MDRVYGEAETEKKESSAAVWVCCFGHSLKHFLREWYNRI